jgi:tetrahydromethanopterin S-methyltransferase subunit G
MTERASASKRLEDKVDILTVGLYSMQGDIKAILERIEMQPKIDQQSFNSLKQANINCQSSNKNRFENIENRVDKVESNQTWIARTVIGQVILIIFGAIATIYQLSKGL